MEVVGYQYHDPVNHPSHYTQGKIEVIDFIQDKKLNFSRGNAVKYIVRAGLKDPAKEIEDLEKAIFYIKAEIKDIQEKNKKISDEEEMEQKLKLAEEKWHSEYEEYKTMVEGIRK